MISVAVSTAFQWMFAWDSNEWNKCVISIVPCKARHVGRSYVIMALLEFVVTQERWLRMPALWKGFLHGLGYERTCQARTWKCLDPSMALTVLWEKSLGELEEDCRRDLCFFSGKPAGLLIDKPLTGAVPCEDTFLGFCFLKNTGAKIKTLDSKLKEVFVLMCPL